MPDLQGIALGRNLDGRLELVATTNDTDLSPGGPGSVWHRSQLREGGWSGAWRSLDIPIGWGWGGPAIARNKDGRLEVAVTSLGELLHGWQTATQR